MRLDEDVTKAYNSMCITCLIYHIVHIAAKSGSLMDARLTIRPRLFKIL